MAWPDLRAEVAFASNPLATPSWTTVHSPTTNTALAVETRAGRDFELDSFQPGQLSLTLDNSDRRFDPLHVAGPYYGSLLPMRRCRVQADWGAELALTGASGSRCTTPDTAALDITGDIEFRVRVACDDWTPATASALISKSGFLTNQGSWLFALNTDGTIGIATTPNGSGASVIQGASTVAAGAADGSTLWLRATLDVDDGGGNRVYRFYTSTDDTWDHSKVTWTQLGSTVTTAGTTSIYASSADASIGAQPDAVGQYLTGTVYAVAVFDGIGGTAVADVDFTDGARFSGGDSSGTDAAGLVWTVSSPASLVAHTYGLFSGFVDQWPQSYDEDVSTCALAATDGFKVLSRSPLASAWEESVLADGPVGWWRLGDDTPTSIVATDSSGGGRDGTYVNSPASASGLVAGDGDGAVDFDGTNDKLDLPAAAFGTPFVAGSLPQSWELWISTTQVPSGSSPGAVILAGTNTLGTPWADMFAFHLRADGTVRFTADWHDAAAITTSAALNDGSPHHLVATIEAGTVSLYVDGALDGTDTHAVSDSFGADRVRAAAPRANVSGYEKYDGIIDEIAFYTSALSATRVAAHYAAGNPSGPWTGDTTGERITRVLDLAGWPTADRDIDTGLSTLGPYTSADQTALAAAQQAEAAEAGALHQDPDGTIVFRDRHTTIEDFRSTVTQHAFSDATNDTAACHYSRLDLSYDADLIANVVDVTWSDGAVVVEDAASIATYTRQALTIDTGLSTAAEAQARGEWAAARFADPSVRPQSVTITPSADDSLWRAALATRLGDRVTARRHPRLVGDPIDFDAIVESISHRITDGINQWETTFGLSPAPIDEGWLILDDAADGLLDTGRLAF